MAALIEAASIKQPEPTEVQSVVPKMTDPLGDIRVFTSGKVELEKEEPKTPEPEKKEEPKKKPEPVPEKEPVKEPEKTPEPTPEPEKKEPEFKSDSARENFKRLESEKRALEKQLEEANKQREEAIRLARAASVRRDPEFVRKYVEPKKAREADMVSLAKAGGVDESAFKRAIMTGDEEQLAEWRENLKPAERVRWDAHRTAISNIDFEAQRAEEDSDKLWEEISQKRASDFDEQRKVMARQNMEDADAAISQIVESVPWLADQEELRAEIAENVQAMAGKQNGRTYATQDILRIAGSAFLQQHVMMQQKTAIEKGAEEVKRLSDELDATKKELAERDEFIKKHAGGSPRSDGFGASAPPGPMTDPLGDIRIATPSGYR